MAGPAHRDDAGAMLLGFVHGELHGHPGGDLAGIVFAVDDRGDLAFPFNARPLADLTGAVFEPIQIRHDAGHSMARIAAQFGFDQQLGDDLRVIGGMPPLESNSLQNFRSCW